MEQLCITIEECWDRDPDARLSAHCVLNRLKDLDSNVNDSGKFWREECHGRTSSEFHSSTGETSFSNDIGITAADLSEDTEHSSSSSAKGPLIVDLPV